MFDKFKQKLYIFKRKLKYLLNPGLELRLKRRAEKLLGGKVVDTTDIFYGIRPEDCIPKGYKAEDYNDVGVEYVHSPIIHTTTFIPRPNCLCYKCKSKNYKTEK